MCMCPWTTHDIVHYGRRGMQTAAGLGCVCVSGVGLWSLLCGKGVCGQPISPKARGCRLCVGRLCSAASLCVRAQCTQEGVQRVCGCRAFLPWRLNFSQALQDCLPPPTLLAALTSFSNSFRWEGRGGGHMQAGRGDDIHPAGGLKAAQQCAWRGVCAVPHRGGGGIVWMCPQRVCCGSILSLQLVC